jgi:hypothetical protein
MSEADKRLEEIINFLNYDGNSIEEKEAIRILENLKSENIPKWVDVGNAPECLITYDELSKLILNEVE